MTLLAAHSERTKGMPTASYGQMFNAPDSQIMDRQTLIDLSYNHPLAEDSAVSGRLYMGWYDYVGDYINDLNAPLSPPLPATYAVLADGRWLGAELRYVAPRSGRHKWLLGADYQLNLRQDQWNHYVGSPNDFEARERNHDTWGLLVHDEITLTDDLSLQLGVRLDRPVTGGNEVHPRLGLSYHWSDAITLKLLYGSAFRAPNAYERYYYGVNPNLVPEDISTHEFVLEHHFTRNSLLSATLFQYRVNDLINFTSVQQLENLGSARAKGIELQQDTRLRNGGRLTASYSWQLAESSDGRWLGNSPRHMAKISLHQPLFSTNWQAGLEMQYFGPRRNQGGTIVGGYTLANLNLLNRRIARDLEFSLRVSNLFDKSYADPAAIDFAPLDRVTQDGREWVARLEYQF